MYFQSILEPENEKFRYNDLELLDDFKCYH